MAAKTQPLPTIEAAEADLQQAKANLEMIHAAVVAGDSKVDASDIAKARSAIEFAELRVKLAVDAAQYRSDQARTSRIDEVLVSITTGSIAAQARRVAELEAKAIQVIGTLFEQAVSYQSSVSAARAELDRLRPLPEGVHVSMHGPLEVHGAHIDGSSPISGSWAGYVVRGAVHAALDGKPSSQADKDLFNLTSHGHTNRFSDDRKTFAQALADTFDRINPSHPAASPNGVNATPAGSNAAGTEGGEVRTSAEDPPAPMQHLPTTDERQTA